MTKEIKQKAILYDEEGGFGNHCDIRDILGNCGVKLMKFFPSMFIPVTVVLDCTKAFDLAKYNILFTRLLATGMPAVVVRVLAQSY